jgi:hypothetical protein
VGAIVSGVNPSRWVCRGPVHRTDWCVLPDPDPAHVAPGGVVLCVEGTGTPHADAELAAVSAWEMLDRWRDVGRRAGHPVFAVPPTRE